MKIKDEDYFDEEDKSILNLSYKEQSSEPSQELTLIVTFNDTKAISPDIREPDTLEVDIILPKLVVDA